MRGRSPGRFISVAGREAPEHWEHGFERNNKREHKEERNNTPGQDYIENDEQMFKKHIKIIQFLCTHFIWILTW